MAQPVLTSLPLGCGKCHLGSATVDQSHGLSSLWEGGQSQKRLRKVGGLKGRQMSLHNPPQTSLRSPG